MIRLRHFAAVAMAAAITLPLSALAQNVLDNVKKRGTLIVGVKADYKPYGFRDPSGKIVGIEPDLAQDVADRLGWSWCRSCRPTGCSSWTRARST